MLTCTPTYRRRLFLTKLSLSRLEDMTASSNVQTPMEGYRAHRSQGNTTTRKHNKLPVTDTKETETHKLHDKESKIIDLTKFREVQENTDK